MIDLLGEVYDKVVDNTIIPFESDTTVGEFFDDEEDKERLAKAGKIKICFNGKHVPTFVARYVEVESGTHWIAIPDYMMGANLISATRTIIWDGDKQMYVDYDLLVR